MALAVQPKARSETKADKRTYKFRRKPYAHQVDGVRMARRLKAIGLFCEPGTGKSKIAIDLAGTLIEEGKIRAVLIICPLSAAGVWVQAIKDDLPTKYPRRIINLAGEGSNTRTYLDMIKPRDGITDFYIINYETLWRVGPKLKARTKPELIRNGITPIVKHFLKFGGIPGKVYSQRGDMGWYENNFEMARKRVTIEDGTVPMLIVADEVHNIKNRTANKTIAVHELSPMTPYRLGLTGTPITQKPLDAFSEFKYIDARVYGLNFDSFRQQFAFLDSRFPNKVLMYQNLDRFADLLHEHALVVKKEDCLDLPEKSYETIPVQLTEKTKKIYKDMANRLVAEIEEYVEEAEAKGQKFQVTARIVLTKLLRLSQITSGFIKDIEGITRRVGVEKLRTTVDMIDNLIEEGENIVVFCRFRQELKDLKEMMDRRKVPVRMIYGDVSQADRTKNVEDFQSSKDPMIMLCQIASGSISITLHAARTAIFYNLDYSASNYVQAQDRIHRIGQTRKVNYLHMIVPGTIDEIIYEGLKGKIELAKTILTRPKSIIERMKNL